jgi:hypothetical protein
MVVSLSLNICASLPSLLPSPSCSFPLTLALLPCRPSRPAARPRLPPHPLLARGQDHPSPHATSHLASRGRSLRGRSKHFQHLPSFPLPFLIPTSFCDLLYKLCCLELSIEAPAALSFPSRPLRFFVFRALPCPHSLLHALLFLTHTFPPHHLPPCLSDPPPPKSPRRPSPCRRTLSSSTPCRRRWRRLVKLVRSSSSLPVL